MDLRDHGGGSSTDPDLGTCISDVLLDMGTLSTQFILALQNMERSTRQARLANGTTADVAERKKQIERMTTDHIKEIRALCDRMSSDPKEGINDDAPVTPRNRTTRIVRYSGSGPNINHQLPNLKYPARSGNMYRPSGGAASPLLIQSSPPSAGAKGKASNSGTRLANKDTNINGYRTSRIEIEPQPDNCIDISSSPEQSGDVFTPCPGEGSNESNGDACSEMEVDEYTGTLLAIGCESPQDAAFWGASSDSDWEPEPTHTINEELSSPSMQPGVQVRMETPPDSRQSLDSDWESEPPRAIKQESLSPPNSEHILDSDWESEPPRAIKQESLSPSMEPEVQVHVEKRPNPKRTINEKNKSHLAVPHPRGYYRAAAPYILNEDSRQSAIQSKDVVDTLGDERYRPNRTIEDHNLALRAAVRERWNPLSDEEKQVYLAKCYQGWKCFYCQTMEISTGCISQVSKFDCPTTMRRGVPCHVASYDEEKDLYSWRKLPRRKKLPQETFNDVYFIICGRGRPKAEQQFLERMFQTRNRCLNCMLDTKTHKKGDRCMVQRLSKPESWGEEYLETCTKCARLEENCMVSVPMNPDANGKPANYGLGKVTSGRLEVLGPRFLVHRRRSDAVPSAPVAAAAIQTGVLGDDGPANMCDGSKSKNPEIRRVHSAINANPPPAKQAVKRTISMPEYRSNDPGESSAAGAASRFGLPEQTAPECPGMLSPGRKRDHSPPGKSNKCKIMRHYSPPSYDYQLHYDFWTKPFGYNNGR